MTREEAFILVKDRVKNENLIKHMLAVEAIMRSLARKFDQNEEDWALAGLLHDADYEETATAPEKGGVVIAEELRQKGIPEEICHAIMAHNAETGTTRDTLMDKAIFAADPLTGLIVATALVLPDKKLSGVTVENILNRYKEKSFAKGARREDIATCQELGLSLEEFVGLGLRAMQDISNDLGL